MNCMYKQQRYYNTEVESSRTWRVLQGTVASVSEGTIKAYGFNRAAIGIGMEVVIELSRKSSAVPFVHGVVLNLEHQGRIGITIWAVGIPCKGIGIHAGVIYNNLSKHAVMCRCSLLLLRRPAGCKACILVSVISIIDGQSLLCKQLWTGELKPAIHSSLSVSGVGSAAQNLSIKKLGHSYKSQLADYRIYEDFVKLGSDLGPTIQKVVPTRCGWRQQRCYSVASYGSPDNSEFTIEVVWGELERYRNEWPIHDWESYKYWDLRYSSFAEYVAHPVFDSVAQEVVHAGPRRFFGPCGKFSRLIYLDVEVLLEITYCKSFRSAFYDLLSGQCLLLSVVYTMRVIIKHLQVAVCVYVVRCDKRVGGYIFYTYRVKK